jgi:hypothetical protein
MNLILPNELQTIFDTAVSQLLKGDQIPDNFKLVEEWFQGEGWDQLVDCWNDEIVLNLDGLAHDCFSDREMISYLGLSDDEVISDQLRLKFAKERITYNLEQGDDCINPSVISFPLFTSQGQSVILGYTVEIHGQFGPAPECCGLFYTQEDFILSLKQSGFWTKEYLDQIDDETILSLWGK